MRFPRFTYTVPQFMMAKLFVIWALSANAQSKAIPDDWFLRDPQLDSLQGVSSERTYQTLLNGKPSRTVIVAVVDSGVDIEHEDLKDVLWINEDEIPGNGIDDDQNGYVDDVHGWNFIGGKNGNVNADTYELTREFVRLKAKYGQPGIKVSKKQQPEYDSWLKIKDKFEKLKEKNNQQYKLYASLYSNVRLSIDTLQKLLNTTDLTREKLEGFQTNSPTLLFSKGFLLNMFRNMEDGESLDAYMGQLKEAVEYYEVIVKYGYNEDFNSREIVGDDYANPFEKGYGNNDVKGPDSKHGTHVAGIIAANRNNNIGMRGIADNVRVMAVRAVPNGDERDKDVANAIIYAVDNGAHIINMSFGKSYSPQKDVVDKAVKYAEQKGVLLIHAAGNDAENSDEEKNFPTRFFLDGKEARNWLEIGASASGADENFVADFSNYGKRNVDFFSPGVEIYSSVPGSRYEHQSGTSMASPSAAGVAALVMSYFPELTAFEIRDILRQSTRKFDNLEVEKPGGGRVRFETLSNTGGLINAYEAVLLAQRTKEQKSQKTR